MSEPQATVWEDAVTSAALTAVAPDQLGGVLIRALPGPVRDTWLKKMKALFPKTSPFRRVPNHATEARLLGGLDLAATLNLGRPVAENGLLAEADGGVIVIPMAERLTPVAASCIATTLDTGEVRRERDGLQGTSPSRFAVIAFDEGIEGDDAVPEALRDRLAFHVDLTPVSSRDAKGRWPSQKKIRDAQALLPSITVTDDDIERLCALSLALGVHSGRAPLFALSAARASAALAGRLKIEEDDLDTAARLVLGPRATQIPQADTPQEETETTQPDQPETENENSQQQQQTPAEDDILSAAEAALPKGLLEALSQGQSRRSSGAGSRAGQLTASKTKGRPIGTKLGDPRRGGRLNILATLRAAAPWQGLRRHLNRDHPAAVILEKDDFRLTRFKHRKRTVTVFVVDASGSAARQRLAEAKGAVELLLAECYVRRDEVALITFKDTDAELVLPPTRSLVRAKRALAGLPGGGGTPLAAALHASRQLADTIKRAGHTPAVVFLTDAGANITLEGQADRSVARADAEKAARLLQADNVPTILLDTSVRPRERAQDLAKHMGAAYVPMPQADAASVNAATQDFMTGATRG